jgi:nitroreductase
MPAMVQKPTKELMVWERDTAVKSISCVCMLILLAAESLGLGACYMTGPLIAEHIIKNHIKIKPGRSVAAIIPVGYKI